MFSLVDYISQSDKDFMDVYCTEYAQTDLDNIDLFLSDWSKNKKKIIYFIG